MHDPPARRQRRGYLIYAYHPIVTKLSLSFALLGLLILTVSSAEGRSALSQIHFALALYLPLAVFFLAVLFGVSTLSPFIPEFLVTVASGFILGLWAGGIFAIIAITVAASGNFFIARRYGQRVVHRMFDLHSADEIRWTAERVTPMMVFLTWLLPSINFDLISYASGLSRLPYGQFLALTIGGNLLSSAVLVFLGATLRSDQAIIVVAALFLYTIVGLGLYVKELPPWLGGSPLTEREP